MSFEEESRKLGRIPLEFVDLEMGFCGNTSGVAPCTSSATGDGKCHNTYGTCLDKDNYTPSSKTYTFCQANAALPVGVQAWPLLKKLTLAPQVLTPGKGMGVRGSVTVRFADMPDTDAMTDPYVAERSYKPEERGTFWGKFRARNEFYEGRLLTIRTGYLVNGVVDAANFQSRVYVIESFKGPAKDGEVQIVAKDVLKLADDNRAMCPPPSKGRLAADISDTDMAFVLSPAGIGDEDYPSGTFRAVIGGEGMDCTRTLGSDSVTITARNVYGTEAKEHSADDTVQVVKRFIDAEIHEVANDLLVNYTPSFKSAWITLSDWQAERDTFLPGLWTTDICEPTGVNTLLAELQEQGCCYIWSDDAAQQVRFRALRPPSAGDPELREGRDFVESTVVASDDASQRVSRVFIYYDRKDPTKKLDEQNNYRQRYLGPDLESESANEYGSVRIKTIYSRWFRSTSLGRVQTLADTLLKRYGKPPRMLQFDADMSLINTVKLADRFVASTRQFQDASGANALVSMQAIEMVQKPGMAGSQLQVKAQEYVWNERINDSSSLQIIISADTYNLNLYDAFVDEYGTPLATQTVVFLILPGVVVGSTNTTEYALRSGNSWPVGLALSLVNKGYVSGKGGKGGRGGQTAGGTGLILPGDGEDGGPGLLAEYPLVVDNTDGTIQGGGSGGGGGADDNPTDAGGGAGGGAGAMPGEGGEAAQRTGGGSSIFSQPGDDGTLTAGGLGGAALGAAGNGGNGGDPGAAGTAGAADGAVAGGVAGSPGNAVEGNSLITWVATGTRLGSIVS